MTQTKEDERNLAKLKFEIGETLHRARINDSMRKGKIKELCSLLKIEPEKLDVGVLEQEYSIISCMQDMLEEGMLVEVYTEKNAFYGYIYNTQYHNTVEAEVVLYIEGIEKFEFLKVKEIKSIHRLHLWDEATMKKASDLAKAGGLYQKD